MLNLYILLTYLICAYAGLPTEKISPEISDQYNFNTYHETMEGFEEKYGVYFNSIKVDTEFLEYIFSDDEVEHHHALFKRSTPSSFVLIDKDPLAIGVQNMPWKPSLWNEITSVPSDGLPECQAVGGGYSVGLNSQKGRQLSASTYYSSVNVLNPQNLEVVTTILGSSQLDQFGAGSLNLVGPIVAIFSLFAYDRNRVYCRAILGLAPSTINTMIINNQGYAQPSQAFLAAVAGSFISLAVGVSQNVGNRLYFNRLRFNGIDYDAFLPPLVPLPVCQSYTSRWCLNGLSVSVTPLYSSTAAITTNLMGFAFLDNLNPFILFPNALVDEIYSKIPNAAKYPPQGSTIANLWAVPCRFPAAIGLLFSGSSTRFMLMATMTNVGPAWIQKGMCEGSIQYSNSAYSVLGAPFLTSIYSVYYYNPSGKGFSISLAQAGSPPAT